MPEQPKILTRQAICNSRLFRVEGARIRFSNGTEMDYEYLCSSGVAPVIIVPILPDGRVVLVREFGIGINGYEWGLPKGKVDEGETHEQAANRELMEEAGYGAKTLHLLKCMTQSPNYMQHKTQIVLAEDLYPQKREGDEPEPLDVEAFSMDDIGELVLRADVTEARTIAALYLARDWLAKRNP